MRRIAVVPTRLRYFFLLVLLSTLVVVITPADAQTLLLTLDSPSPQYMANFGSSLAVGDVDGDGKGDVAVGAVFENVGPISDAGRVYVFSGANGSLLLTLDTPNPRANGNFGSSVAVGDVNGDGRPDIAVAAASENVGGNYAQGRAYVFSGAGGSLLLTLNIPNPQAEDYFGFSLAVGDVDGDGNADIAVGAPYEYVGDSANQGRTYVFSGASGSLLFTLDSPNPQSGVQFGVSLAMGDVIGDGKADIAVGAHFEKVNGNISQGRAYIFSGVDGSVLLTLNTPNPQVQAGFGSSVAAGDVNGDGKGDIAVAAPWEDVGGIEFQGRAYVFSAPTPTPTPTRPPGVGGAVNLPPAAIAAESDAQAERSGWPVGAYAALGGMAVVVAVGGWYARRRRLR
jgi:hypothetical protein